MPGKAIRIRSASVLCPFGTISVPSKIAIIGMNIPYTAGWPCLARFSTLAGQRGDIMRHNIEILRVAFVTDIANSGIRKS
jgi:hypothetical protein